MDFEKRVMELAEERLADKPELFLVDVNYNPANHQIMVLIDGDNGAGIADCASVSRNISHQLDEELPEDFAYNLEVSTPGVDTPLKLQRQYIKNIGRQVAVKLSGGQIKEGKLLAASESTLTIAELKKEKGKKAVTVETELPLTEVSEIRVLISFK